MNKIVTLLLLLIVALPPLCLAATRPNIVYIMVDDLGQEWISSYGAEGIETPNIDALAESGMRFQNAYSMPQCTPTRVTLLTGQYPYRHGWVNHWDVPRWPVGCHFDAKYYTTFARILRDAGYSTAAAGKWQINDFRIQPDAMQQHGFDEYCMWTGFEDENPPSAERYWNPYIHSNSGSKTYNDEFGTDVFVDFLETFMEEHRDEPMFLYFAMALTHTPFVHTPAEPEVEDALAKHKAMVRYVDRAVGRIVSKLDALGLRENTIIFFTTDNGTTGKIKGYLNGQAVRGGKAKLVESGSRGPFIVNGPGIVPSGVVTEALTDFTDMLPTFAELAGAEIPADHSVDGVSIAGLLTGKETDTSRDTILSMGFGKAKLNAEGRVVPQVDFADRIIRNKRYKLWVENGVASRLYDLKQAPLERDDLFDSKDPVIIAQRAKLEAALASLPNQDAAPKYDN